METLDVGTLELLAKGRGVRGSVPIGRAATRFDRGRVRKIQFADGAFNHTLELTRTGERNVHLLHGHDYSKPIGAAYANEPATLRLNATANALEFEQDALPNVPEADVVRELIAANLIAGVSPGFRVPPRAAVGHDVERELPEPGNPGVFIREIMEVGLFELSLVASPTFKDSQVDLLTDIERTRRRRSVVVL